jgi:hypothetical protein
MSNGSRFISEYKPINNKIELQKALLSRIEKNVQMEYFYFTF